MKILRILFVLLIIQFFIGQIAVYAEVIYKKNGEVIHAKVVEKTEDTIWYEIATEADIIEYNSVEISEVVKILNDDGGVSEYSPTYVPPKVKK